MKVALAELSTTVQEVLTLLPEQGAVAAVIALSGELGAGKTTFVQALGKALGVKDTMQSPTYVFMKKYAILHPRFKTLIHIDAYRLSNAREFEALKPAQFLNDPANLVCIEWPERVVGALPEPDVTVNFSSEGAKESERFIEIEK